MGLTSVQLCHTESSGTVESGLSERRTAAGKPSVRSGSAAGNVHKASLPTLSGQHPLVSAMTELPGRGQAQKMHNGKRKLRAGAGLLHHLHFCSFYIVFVQAPTSLLGVSGWERGPDSASHLYSLHLTFPALDLSLYLPSHVFLRMNE